jgi:GT2 family glycosyltransferase
VSTEDASPCVTVVVLSYNRPALLEAALQSIQGQTYPNLDVLVIDNKSGSSPQIRNIVAAFSGVSLISNDSNRGFTGGMNQGIAAARGEYVYLTEDDIELAPDCLAQLVRHLGEHPTVGLAGPVMWNRHSLTIRCAGGYFSLGPIYQMRITAADEPELSSDRPFETMFLPGAMIGARTAVLRELGGFHADFFMYREDVELCARVLKRGLHIAIVPAAKVYHHEPPAGPDPPILMFHKHKNLAALYLLHAPLAVLPEFLVRYAGVEAMRHLLAQRPSFGAWLKAWAWVAWHAPKLFAERARQ